MIDRDGIIRWLNPAAKRVVGDVSGRQFTSVVAPEDKRRAQEIFTRNLFGKPAGSDNRIIGLTTHGERFTVEVSAVPLERGGHVIGVFGQAKHLEEDTPVPAHPHLTPRQSEVLGLLEHGRSTEQIAKELSLSVETVRNHVRNLMQALGVHTRLEAVAVARHDPKSEWSAGSRPAGGRDRIRDSLPGVSRLGGEGR